MYRFLDNQYLAYRSMTELTTMLSIAYGGLEETEENSYDRIRVLAGIRKITGEMNARVWNQARPKPPTPRM